MIKLNQDSVEILAISAQVACSKVSETATTVVGALDALAKSVDGGVFESFKEALPGLSGTLEGVAENAADYAATCNKKLEHASGTFSNAANLSKTEDIINMLKSNAQKLKK